MRNALLLIGTIAWLVTVTALGVALFPYAPAAPRTPTWEVHPVTNPHCGIVVEDDDDQLGFCPENDGPEQRDT